MYLTALFFFIFAEDLEVDVEGIILNGNEGDLFVSFSAGMEHSYSTPAHAWL